MTIAFAPSSRMSEPELVTTSKFWSEPSRKRTIFTTTVPSIPRLRASPGYSLCLLRSLRSSAEYSVRAAWFASPLGEPEPLPLSVELLPVSPGASRLEDTGDGTPVFSGCGFGCGTPGASLRTGFGFGFAVLGCGCGGNSTGGGGIGSGSLTGAGGLASLIRDEPSGAPPPALAGMSSIKSTTNTDSRAGGGLSLKPEPRMSTKIAAWETNDRMNGSQN